ncbi:MAG: class I SAM-dependent methyltransferase [Chloroflexota bacterium]|nr:MAG: class I SAM-dependent methyltransferase [Chloroflexota bacterium]
MPTADRPTTRDIGAFYDRFWQPENQAVQDEHDFHGFQDSLEQALAWLLTSEGGLDGRRLLEIGPGRGRDTESFARAGARIVALDVASASVTLARERLRAAGYGDRIDCIVADAANLPFRDGAFDVTFSRFVIAHVDTQRMANELARAIAPGGRAIFVEPLRHNPLVSLYRRFSPTGCRETAPRYISLGDARRMGRLFPRGIRHREFYFFSVAALAARGTALFRPLATILQWLELPLTMWTPLRAFCWVIVAELRR